MTFHAKEFIVQTRVVIDWIDTESDKNVGRVSEFIVLDQSKTQKGMACECGPLGFKVTIGR